MKHAVEQMLFDDVVILLNTVVSTSTLHSIQCSFNQ